MAWLEDRLEALERADRRRHLRALESAQGSRIRLDGVELINFSSNDYLGLAGHPEVREAARRALDTHGFGAGSARLLAGNFELANQLEAALSSWLGAEAALLFGSGYHANLSVLPALCGPGDRIVSDELNHASIIDGCRLSRASVHIYPHRQLDIGLASSDWVVTETLFSMDGDAAGLFELSERCRTSGARLVVDEAHAIGCHGDRGAGFGSASIDARVGTFGKALGSYGAFVVGSSSLVELLLNTARPFIFTTGLPAPVLAASLAAVGIAAGPRGDELRLQLGRRVEQLARGLVELGYPVTEPATAIFPIVLGSARAALEASARLEADGLLAQAVRPPTVAPGTSRLRVVVTARHTEEDVARLLAALPKDEMN